MKCFETVQKRGLAPCCAQQHAATGPHPVYVAFHIMYNSGIHAEETEAADTPCFSNRFRPMHAHGVCGRASCSKSLTINHAYAV